MSSQTPQTNENLLSVSVQIVCSIDKKNTAEYQQWGDYTHEGSCETRSPLALVTDDWTLQLGTQSVIYTHMHTQRLHASACWADGEEADKVLWL